MCRNIRTLYNFEPSATDDEVHAASLQFVRKISGFHTPSEINVKAFNQAVDDVAHASRHLIEALKTNAPTKNREDEATKAKARSAKRFGTV